MRRLYDARALDTLQSDATLETLSTQGKCRKGCDTSDAKAATVECVSPCDGSDATSATRKEVTQEGADKEGRKNTADGTETASLSPAALNAENQNGNNDKNGNGAPREQRHDDGDDRLISFAFPGGASEKQRAATVNAIANAIRQGASYPLLAHAVISSKVEGDTPWERIENAGRRTAGLLSTARWTWPDFKGGTLLELLEHADRTQKVDQLAWELGGWRKQVVEWPDNGVAASDAVAPKR
jgi:hypothetical protein